MAKLPVRLKFLGGAGTVTGSKFLIQVEKQKVLVDCGMFQGRKDLRLRNWSAPEFDPTTLDAVVVTHAHLDHTGYLPVLVKQGYKGIIYATYSTKELMELVLLDAAHLQEEEARYANKWQTSKHAPAKPLFDVRDARQVIKQVRCVPFNKPTAITKDIVISAIPVGHILGAAAINLETQGRRITFSGDVGSYNVPILRDPFPVQFGDLVLCESTYGDRTHQRENLLEDIANLIKKALLSGGPIIIPSFAIGRTQLILYYLSKLEKHGMLPIIPVYVDSPMACNCSDIYRKHTDEYNAETLRRLKECEVPLVTAKTMFCVTREQSKRLNYLTGARIIISASGMLTGGRVLHHAMNWLPNKSATFIFAGYQAEETRGRQIITGEDSVKIFGQTISVCANIEQFTGFSAHADRNELIKWLASSGTSPREVKVVHGEGKSADSFCEHLKAQLGWQTSVAKLDEEIEL
ncbi:MAG: MBL fold metallo-hydrolase [Deltaproteobacteria bacterium]|jgi:metallo-beta-lactamase family protein|nr:MBL fold metallo-hydrolase [Deltaproteobacteria bacterium]